MRIISRTLCLVFLALLLAGCAYLRASGERDVAGRPTGTWTLYRNSDNAILGVGKFIEGRPHGWWTLWDDGKSRVADLNFDHGLLEGEYKFFYTSHSPSANNRLKTIGHAKAGILFGDFERYLPNGSLLVRYHVDQSKVISVSAGTFEDAQSQLNADAELLMIYYKRIMEAH